VPIRQDTLRERWLAQNRYAPTTEDTYRSFLDIFQRRFPVYAEKVTEAMLVDYLTTDETGEPTRRAPSTLRRQRATLRSFWRWANRNGYVAHDPSLNLDLVQLGTGERRPGRWLTADDALRLLDACEDGSERGVRDHALVAVALLTGLRRAELAALPWRAVDLTQRRLSVRGKGSKHAVIGLPEQAAAAVHRWRETAISVRGRKPGPNDPVFPTGQCHGGLHGSEMAYDFDWSRALSKWGVRAIIARRADDAGLGAVATHDLRRSFAGFLEERGVDLGGIQAALRHASPDVTQRCYLERSPRRALRAVEDLHLAERGPAAGTADPLTRPDKEDMP
jgi:integrase/recombinase XerC